jgi:hypothetical protein
MPNNIAPSIWNMAFALLASAMLVMNGALSAASAEPLPLPTTAQTPLTSETTLEALPLPNAERANPQPDPALPMATQSPENTSDPLAVTPLAVTPLPVTPPSLSGGDLTVESLPAHNPPESAANALPAPVKTPAYMPKIRVIKGDKTQQLLEEPVHIDDSFSLMFSNQDMETIVLPSLELYDRFKSQGTQTQDGGSTAGDDLTGLLESLKIQGETKQTTQTLSNIYLGSIVYYSPENWSIWLNGKKLVHRINAVSNPLYVSSIDRTHAVLVWKPAILMNMGKLWDEKSMSPDTLPKDVVVDAANKMVTLTMRPNQTFVPQTLTIYEGLVKQSAAETASETAPTAQQAPNLPPVIAAPEITKTDSPRRSPGAPPREPRVP